MNDHYDALPADVRAALERGDQIEAIKRLRLATGLGLKEAKDAIDAITAGRPMPTSGGSTPPSSSRLPTDGTLPAEVLALLASDGKLAAIKRLRELTGLGLKEAKDAVEALPVPRSGPGSTPASKRTPTIVGESSTLASTIALVLLAVAVAAAAAWLTLR